MQQALHAKKQPAILFIFITILIDVIGFGLIIPILPDLIGTLKNVSVAEAAAYGTALLTVFAVMQFFFSPIIGGLSDRFGRRPVLLFALAGFSLDYFLTAWAPTYNWLFVGRVIAGITGSSISVASSYIADISAKEDRAKNFGMIGAAFGIGFVIGPVLGALIAHFYGIRAPFIAAGIFTLLNFIFGYFVLPESLKKENRRPFDIKRANPVGTLLELKKYPQTQGLLLALFLLFLASQAVQCTWPYYTKFKFNWTEIEIGISLAVVGVLVGAVQGGLVRFTIPKFGANKNIYYGLIFYSLGCLLFAIAPQGWYMYLFLIFYCMGGISQPALQSVISGKVAANQQGELQGGLTSLQSLSAIFGPIIMGGLFTYFSGGKAPFYFPGAAFALGSILFVVAMFLALKTLRKNVP